MLISMIKKKRKQERKKKLRQDRNPNLRDNIFVTPMFFLFVHENANMHVMIFYYDLEDACL